MVGPDSSAPRGGVWTFFSNHAHVLVLLGRDADARLRDLARTVGVTERAVHRIITDLEAAGVVEHQREGRRNHYTIHPERQLRHPIESHCTVGDLLRMVWPAAHAESAGQQA